MVFIKINIKNCWYGDSLHKNIIIIKICIYFDSKKKNCIYFYIYLFTSYLPFPFKRTLNKQLCFQRRLSLRLEKEKARKGTLTFVTLHHKVRDPP